MTYTAKYTTGEIIDRHEKSGNLFGHLPLGAIPIREYRGKLSSLYIKEIDDPWKEAFFRVPSGRVIVVKRD